MAGTNIYPPIFTRSYMPAFAGNTCRIYFSLSVYNSLALLSSKVQVAIQSQNTNYTALKRKNYPTGIKLVSLQVDTQRQADDKYFVEIEGEWLQGQSFNPGEFYKVQLRFMENGVKYDTVIVTGQNSDETNPIEKITETWLIDNLSKFSQWSQIVLIKKIQKPVITLRDLEQNMDKTTFTLKDIFVSGKITFGEGDNEYLKEYRVYLYDNMNQLKDDSGFKYSNMYSNTNEINYKIKYDLQNGEYYKLKIYYMTNNLYQETIEYEIFIDLVQFTTLQPNKYSITAYSKMDSGVISVELKGTSIINQLGVNFIIRRASNETNFKIWEDMYTFLSDIGQPLNKIWEDKTVQSGMWYKYSFQRRDANGFRSNFLQTPNPVMAMFDDIFLFDDTYKLRIKFDPQLSNYSHVVSESSTQTIGSKFPFIRRNGNVDYRTFTLTGTITHFMDVRDNGMKASPQDLYGQSLDDYKDWNTSHNITPYNDSVYERDFREKVIKFLYENKVKLYKSTTEGNILVKLMNISFTPNNQLSRHIYGFTCTAYQVDQFNVENCIKYGILNAGGYVTKTKRLFKLPGQVSSPSYGTYDVNGIIEGKQVYIPQSSITINNNQVFYMEEGIYSNRKLNTGKKNLPSFNTGENIIVSRILPKYKVLANDLMDIDIEYLSFLKIEFTSPPYLIALVDGTYKKINDNVQPEQLTTQYYKSNVFLGHLITINDSEKPIIVNAEGIYQLSDSNTKITSLTFVQEGETGFITYVANLIQSVKTENIPKTYYNYRKVGQLYDYFLPGESIYKKIFLRYKQDYKIDIKDSEGKTIGASVQKTTLQKLMGIRITANPNIAIAVKQAGDSGYKKLQIGQTGLLELYDDETDIKGFYVLGPYLTEIQYEENKQLREGQYMVYPYDLHPAKKDIENNDIIIKDDDGNDIVVRGFETFEDIPNPKDKCVYTISNSETLYIVLSKLSLVESDTIYRLTESENRVTDADVDTALLLQNISKSINCIYYHGGWYLFSKEEGIVYGYPTEAIIDYYCQILREGF